MGGFVAHGKTARATDAKEVGVGEPRRRNVLPPGRHNLRKPQVSRNNNLPTRRALVIHRIFTAEKR